MIDNEFSWEPENYNPNISVDKWKEMFKNPNIFKEDDLEYVKRICDYNAPFYCGDISLKYGLDANTYSRPALWKRIAEECGTILPDDIQKDYYAVMLYLNSDSPNRARYKVRDEIKQAVDESDFSNISLLAPTVVVHNADNEYCSIVEDGTFPFHRYRGDRRYPRNANDLFLELKEEPLCSLVIIQCGKEKYIGYWVDQELFEMPDLGEDMYGRRFSLYERVTSDEYAQETYPRTICLTKKSKNYSHENMRKAKIEAIEKATNHTKEELITIIQNIFENTQISRTDMNITNQHTNHCDCELNTILYGPPGTGKTYNTVIYAVAIVEKKTVEEVAEEAADYYDVVKARFDEYKEDGKIAFTTFHQSYGYEEFIEGIKPRMSEDDNDAEIEYSVVSGVFKDFCERAYTATKNENIDYGFNKSPNVWKVSLAKTNDNPVRKECHNNNHIRIGWDKYGPEITDDMDYIYGGKKELNAFINKMRIGDIVLSCYTSSTIDAIGVVTGDYEWNESFDEFKRVRNVKWIVKDIKEDIVDLNGGATMTLSTVYKLKITVADVLNIINKVNTGNVKKNNTMKDNYVFIIDEINRGNISKIFGELITLIEDTKRLGAKEEMTVMLPYSPNKAFGVPLNVYILGTMNTADRSIAMIDTALRRRFSFVEKMPDSDVLRSIGADVVEEDGETLNVADMLDIINERIKYLYDREHTIGHAFFTALKDDPSIECLANIFEKSIIPLLQEYFYEDYGKIQIVLGDDGKQKPEYKQYQFIRDTEVKTADLFNSVPDIESQNKKYEIQKSALYMLESYKMIGKGL